MENADNIPSDRASAAPGGEPVAWQWRRKGDDWTLAKTFNSQVFATTEDSEVRALYAAAPPSDAGQRVALLQALQHCDEAEIMRTTDLSELRGRVLVIGDALRAAISESEGSSNG